MARIQNIFRRARTDRDADSIEIGDIRIDRARKTVTRDGEPLELTAAEYGLLELLVSQRDRVLSRDDIMLALRGVDADIYSRAIDVLVSRLRQKLDRPGMIRTVRGQGYQFVNR